MPVESLSFLASDEHYTPDKNGDGVGNVQNTGIENSVCPENRCHYGISDKAHIGKCEHETVNAPLFFSDRHKPWQNICQADEDGVGSYSNPYKRQNIFPVRHLVSHGRRYDETGSCYLNDEIGEFFVKLHVKEFVFVGSKADNDQ